jgi:hypothetical protein
MRRPIARSKTHIIHRIFAAALMISFLISSTAPAMAAGSAMPFLGALVIVDTDGALGVVETAGFSAPVTQGAVTFTVPSANYTALSSPPLPGQPKGSGQVQPQDAAYTLGTETKSLSRSGALADGAYTVTADAEGNTVFTLSPAREPDVLYYQASYERTGAVTRYDDVAELDLVLKSEGEYDAVIEKGLIQVAFAGDIDINAVDVFINGAQRWEISQQSGRDTLDIIVFGVMAEDPMELRLLFPLDYVPGGSVSYPGNARPLVLAQEEALGYQPARPDSSVVWTAVLSALGAWVLAVVLLWSVYVLLYRPMRKGAPVQSPPSQLSPVLAARMIWPMRFNAAGFLAAFMRLIEMGYLSLERTIGAKGKPEFGFRLLPKKEVSALSPHEKAILEWLREENSEGSMVTAREMFRVAFKKPGRYYYASLRFHIESVNDATDLGLLSNTPKPFRLLWIFLGIVYVVAGILPLYWGIFPALLLVLPGVLLFVISRYFVKSCAVEHRAEAGRWLAYRQGIGQPANISGSAGSGQELVSAAALNVDRRFAAGIDGREVSASSGPLLSAFEDRGVFSRKLYLALRRRFVLASWISAALRSSVVSSQRKALYEKIKRKRK